MFKKAIACGLAVVVLLCFLTSIVLMAEAEELSDKMIRLHVIANSDSEEDQALKLAVRDAVLSYVTDKLESADDREEARAVLEENLDEIAALAEEVISEYGYTYEAAAEIGMEEYPTREYDTFSLPAGRYLSLRLTLGEGKGRNWWCVVFPPVCLSSASREELAVMDFTSSEIDLMTAENTGYVLRFRLVELLGELKNKLS